MIQWSGKYGLLWVIVVWECMDDCGLGVRYGMDDGGLGGMDDYGLG